jgi:magnesium transporter
VATRKRPSRKRPSHKPPRPPPGSPPGTLAIDPTLPPPELRLIAYGPDRFEERTLKSPAELAPYLKDGPDAWPVVWLDVDGLGDAQTLETVAAAAGLHKLSLADVAHPYQRPKVEDYGSYLFIIARAPTRSADSDASLDTEQVSFCLTQRLVLTFQERFKPGDCFGPVRDRLRQSVGNLRIKGPDLLVYALLDATVDAYFPLLESLGEQLDDLEAAAMAGIDNRTLFRLHDIRREFLTVRRAAWPLREALGALHRDQSPLISDSTRIYLRDLYDHTIQIIDLVETGRELGTGLAEMHLSLVSQRMNEIIKVLTIITTIFIPLSFIAGIYGMNFDTSKPLNMPELGWRYGYIAVLLFMAIITALMILAFWRRGWIGRGPRAK